MGWVGFKKSDGSFVGLNGFSHLGGVLLGADNEAACKGRIASNYGLDPADIDVFEVTSYALFKQINVARGDDPSRIRVDQGAVVVDPPLPLAVLVISCDKSEMPADTAAPDGQATITLMLQDENGDTLTGLEPADVPIPYNKGGVEADVLKRSFTAGEASIVLANIPAGTYGIDSAQVQTILASRAAAAGYRLEVSGGVSLVVA